MMLFKGARIKYKPVLLKLWCSKNLINTFDVLPEIMACKKYSYLAFLRVS